MSYYDSEICFGASGEETGRYYSSTVPDDTQTRRRTVYRGHGTPPPSGQRFPTAAANNVAWRDQVEERMAAQTSQLQDLTKAMSDLTQLLCNHLPGAQRVVTPTVGHHANTQRVVTPTGGEVAPPPPSRDVPTPEMDRWLDEVLGVGIPTAARVPTPRSIRGLQT